MSAKINVVRCRVQLHPMSTKFADVKTSLPPTLIAVRRKSQDMCWKKLKISQCRLTVESCFLGKNWVSQPLRSPRWRWEQTLSERHLLVLKMAQFRHLEADKSKEGRSISAKTVGVDLVWLRSDSNRVHKMLTSSRYKGGKACCSFLLVRKPPN